MSPAGAGPSPPPLRLDRRCGIVVREGVPWLERGHGAPAHRLPLGAAIALELLAACGDRAAVLRAWPDFLGEGAVWIDHAIDRYWSYLGGSEPRPARFDWLEAVDLDAARRCGPRAAEAAPHALVWLVTLACNRACPYCFYDVSEARPGGPPDARWSHAAILRTLDEMALIGASQLYVTGGEPLLRPDLPAILEAACARRIRPHVATRHRIDAAMAERLAALDLGSFTFSLDAGEARIADALCGRRGFFEEACASLAALSAAGVPVTVNAVATRANLGRLDGLARLLTDLGVPRLEISPYVPPVTERVAARGLAPDAAARRLGDEIAALRAAHGERIEIVLGASGAVPDPAGGGRGAVCEVGFTELHVLPDGRATRCRYLPREAALVVGSLEHQTIREVWSGPRLEALNRPAPAAYAGTRCDGCGGFEGCNARGRCFLGALATRRALRAPDQFCAAP